MKKLICILLCAILFTVPVFADVAVEPYGNDFYMKHMDECDFKNHNYYVNGDEGYVTLWESPEAKKPLRNFENGETVFISVTYDDWGATEYRKDNGEWVTGWLPMDGLVERYESRHFCSEFASEIFEDESLRYALEDYECSGDGVYFYTYPGSGETMYCIEAESIEMWGNMPSFDSFYTDADGHTWGSVPYYYGIKSCWVCLDDPENAELPMLIDRRPEFKGQDNTADIQSAEPVRGEPLKSENTTAVYIAVAGIAVAVVAAALIIFKKKKHN